MLGYLLDENLSPVVAEQILNKNPEIRVHSIFRWRGGFCVGQEDQIVMCAAAEDGLTLVSYDLKTIPLLLAEMAADNEHHAGVLFIDGATLRSNDFGGLVRALLAHCDRYNAEVWTNRIAFLTVG